MLRKPPQKGKIEAGFSLFYFIVPHMRFTDPVEVAKKWNAKQDSPQLSYLLLKLGFLQMG